MNRRRALMGAAKEVVSPYEHGTWDDLLWQIDNGTYKKAYSLGDTFALTITVSGGIGGSVGAQIVAFDADDKADGTGKAPVTIIAQKSAFRRTWNPSLSGDSGARTEGTGTIGGWGKSGIRTYCNSTIYNAIPSTVKARIVSVTKYSYIFNSAESGVNNDPTSDKVWLPSRREMFGQTETQGPVYSGVFSSDSARVKKNKNNATDSYNLRSAYSTANCYQVSYQGKNGNAAVSNNNYYAVGFCLG